MKKIGFILLALAIYLSPQPVFAEENHAILVEVDGDVQEVKSHIETYHPFVTVTHTYDVIFNGLALEGKIHHLNGLEELEQIKSIHQVQEYHTYPQMKLSTKEQNQNQNENILSTFSYTGKGVRVAVIDTGIDYTHPDLKANYVHGYDVVDMDDDPMETLPDEGIPTEHGTHVIGIIAANGEMKGVAPDAEIIAYRALGPGGFGKSVHILAALEEAVKDGAEIINLSLGNSVNGPDYPTSEAVNRAAELGVAVVVANGNSGPEQWTVGSPATATKAIAVGAAQEETTQAYLDDRMERRQVPLQPVQGAPHWNLTTDYVITNSVQGNVAEKIVLFNIDGQPLDEKVSTAQENGAVGIVLIVDKEAQSNMNFLEDERLELTIPVAIVTKEDGDFLKSKLDSYIMTKYEDIDEKTADFSSRGPVTVNWQIKPDVLAPGTNILSTTPGETYQAFSGTSMAAPYVAGFLALMKEAYPDWDVDKLFAAIQTQATPFKKDALPTTQGHGMIQPEKTLQTETIIHNGSLHYGKVTSGQSQVKLPITIENTTNVKQHYRFHVPKKVENYRFNVPLSFTVDPDEKKQIAIELEIQSQLLEEGLHEGYLQLEERNAGQTFYLPYLFVHEAAEQPKTFGFELAVKPFANDYYHYQIYATERLTKFTVDLYDPDTLTWQGELFHIKDAAIGINEGEIEKRNVTPGIYVAQVAALTEDGNLETYEMPLLLE